KVFGPESGQAAVFSEIAGLVQSALDGFRVCIFAYGQTGSGKTHTMSGPPREEGGGGEGGRGAGEDGVIGRAVDMIFAEIGEKERRGWRFEVQVSFLEIYNEALRDLLADPLQSRLHAVLDHPGTNLGFSSLGFSVQRSPRPVTALLTRAERSRATAATSHNDRSSRSHAVFAMRVSATSPDGGEVLEGVLNLIDLAGSERLQTSATGIRGETPPSEGERMRETQAINKSLSSLCDVISALASKDMHVPFRNSKLTYLLQPSLGGDCKCLMFVNVSPASEHFPESVNSLRFASKVSSVQLRRLKVEA
ncbi:P-loop containing nucleoside triphosphate hydrolase protein, partial [Baffinella frigidus]